MRAWICVILGLLAGPALGATYYVDSTAGDDAADGRAADRAWRTLEAVNARTYAGGDAVLLKAGTTYAGRLEAKGSGAAGTPIVVDMYGVGPMPRIDGGGKTPEAVLLRGVEFW